MVIAIFNLTGVIKMNSINEFKYLEEEFLRDILQKHKGLLNAATLCKIYAALNLKTKEKEGEKEHASIGSSH